MTEKNESMSWIKDLDYQAGAIVSREIVRRDSGTVTLFAFDRDQALSEHTSTRDALVTVLEGRAEIRIAGEPRELTAGEMVLMPANVPHAVRAVEAFKMQLVLLARPASS